MKNKVFTKAKEVKTNTHNFLANTQQLVMSVALVVCAYYNYETLSGDIAPFEYWSRLVSSVVLACTAAWAYWHFVKNPRS